MLALRGIFRGKSLVVKILFELLRLHGKTGSFGSDVFRLFEQAIEVPFADGSAFRFWGDRCPKCQPGFTLTAGIYPDFGDSRNRPKPALRFWPVDGPACHRELVPYRFTDSSLGRDEWFAEFPVGHREFRVYDPTNFDGLRYYASLWDEELRGLGLIDRYRGMEAVG